MDSSNDHSHSQNGDDDDDDANGNDVDVETEAFLAPPSPVYSTSAALSVYVNIHRIKRLVLASIDDPYTIEHFREPGLNALVVRPLVRRLYDPTNLSTVFCLLVNRVSFARDQSGLAHQSINAARATLCEVVASRLLRRFDEDNPGRLGLLQLTRILAEGFDPFEGAPSDVQREWRHLQWPMQDRAGYERKLTALELAILSESKVFISSSACQRVVDAMHNGQITYTPLSFVDILPDHFKHRPIALYDSKSSPVLNHRRLIVPRIRNIIELGQFFVLIILYTMTMANRHSSTVGIWEMIFCVYTAGWVLQEFAAIIEHGWELHSQNLWSFLDVTFAMIYSVYFFLRIYDLGVGQLVDGYGLHLLSTAAPILLTRIAFSLMPNNIVFISLHAMMKDFTVLILLAFWCFTGFLVALQWLVTAEQLEDGRAPAWTTVCRWLLWIWFGLDGTGISESTRFGTVLGPVLMIGFAFLGNTLFLTVLVAMLTNTFSRIIANEGAEIRFRRTVLTFEGAKSDSIFAYPPPFNLAALAFLLPLKLMVSSRQFHTINVFLIRFFNAPTLLFIALWERHALRIPTSKTKTFWGRWHFAGFSPHGDIQAVFRALPPQAIADKISELDPLDEVPVLEDDVVAKTGINTHPTQLGSSPMEV